MLVIIGLITATPALALVSPGTLDIAYGIGDVADPMTLALLQHRGLLQGALGAALVWAAFRPLVRVAVAGTAVVTKSTFLALTELDPDVGGAASSTFDVVAVVVLAALIVRQLTRQRRRAGNSPAATGI
ncbi:hypothetical protein HUT18_17670 [Streptomyces sp. NA04227]|nr:hypothetical protein HUT18_17670 [Streptomyces sp. NA04227]